MHEAPAAPALSWEHQSVPAAFSAGAANAPGRAAARERERCINYGELDRASNRLARNLISMGVGRGDLVGLLADRSIEHWHELLAIRFDRLELPAAVIAIRLQGGRGQPLSASTGRLVFSRTGSQRREPLISHLVERLRARIGDESVHGIMTVAEHRPQHAWRAAKLFEQPSHRHATPLLAEPHSNSSLLLRRPLWMLPEPRPLGNEKGLPLYQGRLELLDGPERLETGWWDDDGIARDYFVAANPAGMHLWIFRNRDRESGWYLHGMFG